MKTKEWHDSFKNDLFPSMRKRILKETPQLKLLRKALASINENWKSGLFTDGSTFEHFHHLTNKDLITLSQKLGTQMNIYDDIHEILASLGMNGIVALGFWLDYKKSLTSSEK